MLPSFYGVIEVKHYHQGRLRIQTESLIQNPELETEFLQNIKQIDGIESIKINEKIGSVLILFQERKIEVSFLYLIILKMLHLEEEAFRKKPGKLKVLFRNVLEAVDFSVYNKTKGLLDSKMIVSSIFIYYAIKKLRLTPQLPSGATLLWWAYNLMMKGKE